MTQLKDLKIKIVNLGTEVTDTVLEFSREITMEQAGKIIEYLAVTDEKNK